jgi:nitrite reductase/ring-hydroxylating ferredoxin subunit
MERVGDAGELMAAGRTLVTVGDREVMVFALEGEWFAYENRCPHAGGPVCEGRIMPRVTSEVHADGTVGHPQFDRDQIHVACPWHGWEFNLRTGISNMTDRRRLRRFKVEEREDGVYVSV